MEFEARKSGEGSLAIFYIADEGVHILVTALVMFEMLLKLECFAAVIILAFKDSIGQLKMGKSDNSTYMSSNVSLKVASFCETASAVLKWTVQCSFVVSLIGNYKYLRFTIRERR
jgi:hypothetical protein